MIKTFVTEYRVDGLLFGGQVDAESWEAAEAACAERDHGERVVGILVDSYLVNATSVGQA